MAREIPAHYLEESKAMINDLLEGGIISEVTKPVAWCTQFFFVPKPGTKKLRLVTDYRQINKSLKRPEWPFLPSEAVRRQVDPEAKVFGALDLTSGNHQICLSEEDKDLTTFTLPFGRDRYEVLPMGLKPSSNHFNINSDKAVKGLSGTLKSVDDMLTQGTSWADLRGKMTILFQRFRKLNIKVKPSKLRIGKEVVFGGFKCKATETGVEIQPDPSRLEAISNISPPENKTEVRAFLGMIRQLEAWSPNLSFATKSMRCQTIK